MEILLIEGTAPTGAVTLSLVNLYSSCCGKLMELSAVGLPTEAFQRGLQLGSASSNFKGFVATE